MSRLTGIVIALWALAAPMRAAAPFATPLLERIARAAGVTVADQPLPAQTVVDSVAVVRGRPVYMLTNEWGAVAHIGYRLFNRTLTSQYRNERLFDFVERYLLELDLRLDERDVRQRMHVDGVTLVKGSLDMLRKLTPQADVTLTVDAIRRKIYRLTCQTGSGLVTLTIPADAQLLLGANTIELETMAKEALPHMMSLDAGDVIQEWPGAETSADGRSAIVRGGIYMSEAIRGDLYLAERDGRLQLVCSTASPTRSISNIMLTGIYERQLPLDFRLNEYGQRAEPLAITLQQWIAFAKREQCRLYFGIKSRTADTLKGTLFAYNEQLAYVHMLSVDVPLSLLAGSDRKIRATGYVYIPLQHIPEQYFKQEFNPTIYDEK